MPAITIEMTIAGPALAAAVWPLSTKMPVPMIAPMPRATRLSEPRTRRRPWPACEVATSWSIGLVVNRPIAPRLGAGSRGTLCRDLRGAGGAREGGRRSGGGDRSAGGGLADGDVEIVA